MRIGLAAMAALLPALGGDELANLRAWSATHEGACRVFARCDSSLPEGAQVHLALGRVVESFDAESRNLKPDAGAQAPRSSRRRIEKGRVAAEFDKVEEGSYVVTVRFNPDGQPDEIASSLPSGVAEARLSCPLLVGAPPDVLKALAEDEAAIRASFVELQKIGSAGGEGAKGKLMAWFDEQGRKLSRSWMPATREFARSEARRIAIWGKGPLRSDSGAKEEATWKEFYEMLFTAKHMLLRERFLWDLRIASTLAMEMKASTEAADPAAAWDEVKERQRASWSALDAGLSEGRVRDLAGMIGEPGARLVGRIRAGRDLANQMDPKAADAGARIGGVLDGIRADEPAVRGVPQYHPVK